MHRLFISIQSSGIPDEYAQDQFVLHVPQLDSGLFSRRERAQVDKRSGAMSSTTVASIQMFVNNVAMYDIPIVGVPQLFQQFLEAFPSMETSDYYTDFGNSSQYVICINLRPVPANFIML